LFLEEFKKFINRNPIFDKEGNVVSIDAEEADTACVPTEVTIPIFGSFPASVLEDKNTEEEKKDIESDEIDEAKMPQFRLSSESGYDSVADGYASAEDRTFVESDFSSWEDEDEVFAAKENFPAPTEALSNLSLVS